MRFPYYTSVMLVRRIWRVCFGCGVILAMVVTGCTHTRIMTPDTPSEFYDRISASTHGHTATIHLRNGDEHLGVNVRMTADSVTWWGPDAWTRQFTEQQGAPISDIKEIVVIKRAKGGVIGFGVGAGIGGVFGTIPAALIAHGDNTSNSQILVIGGMFTLACGTAGAFRGASKGSTEIFAFSESLEGTDRHLLSQQLKDVTPGVIELLDRLRQSIQTIKPNKIKEQITDENIVYTSNDKQLCYLITRPADIQIYLPVKPGSVSDPMGLLRPWSSGDSWFSIFPGSDIEYAISLIRQAYKQIL